MTKRLAERQFCKAHRSDGTPCRRAPIKGGVVCATHGGRAPAVKARAAVRLLEASDVAASYLVSVIKDEKLPAETRLKASLSLLDRAGLGGKERVELSVAPDEAQNEPWKDLLPRVLYVVDKPDDETTTPPATPTGRPQAQLEMGTVPPADSEAARAMYEASRTAPDPEPPGATVRVDGPRPRVRRRRA